METGRTHKVGNVVYFQPQPLSADERGLLVMRGLQALAALDDAALRAGVAQLEHLAGDEAGDPWEGRFEQFSLSFSRRPRLAR
jgi:hypothetical protein